MKPDISAGGHHGNQYKYVQNQLIMIILVIILKSQLFRDEHPLLMYCRRLNLPAVKILVWYFMPLVSYHLKPLWQQQVRGGHAPDVVDSEGKGALWYATLPNRRGLGRNLGFNVLVRHFNRIFTKSAELFTNSSVITQGEEGERRPWASIEGWSGETFGECWSEGQPGGAGQSDHMSSFIEVHYCFCL